MERVRLKSFNCFPDHENSSLNQTWHYSSKCMLSVGLRGGTEEEVAQRLADLGSGGDPKITTLWRVVTSKK